jgi:hypothetical protein
MQQIRYLDKLIDELAKGKAPEKIQRKWTDDNHTGGFNRENIMLTEC